MKIDIEKTMQFIRDNARDYAAAKSDRVYLEQFRKSKKAMLVVQAQQSGISTVAQCEAYAYSHPEYLELLRGLQIAVEREEYLKLMIEGCKARVELYRTQQANERAERAGYGA